MAARLSVNLNKVALVRNSRRTNVPNVLRFAALAHDAGAHGVTVHPRPDERHIRAADVPSLAALTAPWRPAFEFNIEGYPEPRLFDLIAQARPEQITLVPDAPDVLTSEEGWPLATEGGMAQAREAIQTLRRIGGRIVLFIDPDPALPALAKQAGADGIEIFTGRYARAFASGTPAEERARAAATAAAGAEAGLVVNIGHDLNLENIPGLIAAAPQVREASIGHELTSDALAMGWMNAVRAYVSALGGATPAGASPSA